MLGPILSFSFRNNLTAAFECYFQTRDVAIGVQLDSFYNFQASGFIIKQKRNSLLFARAQSQF